MAQFASLATKMAGNTFEAVSSAFMDEAKKSGIFSETWHLFFPQSEYDLQYRKPEFLERLTKAKYGENNFVVGATLDELRRFERNVGYMAASDISTPKEVSRVVVDIDTKTHGNLAFPGQFDESNPGQKRPRDWYDEFEITSNKSMGDTKHKSYTVITGNANKFHLGKLEGLRAKPEFFNRAGSGVHADFGINGSGHAQRVALLKGEPKVDDTLSQGYEIVDRLQVAPRTKIKATMTTWAVTYEADVTIRFNVDAEAYIPMRYRTPLSRVLGGIFVFTGYLKASDIFCSEDDFLCHDNMVYFTRNCKVSYLGEEVEINKEKTDLGHED